MGLTMDIRRGIVSDSGIPIDLEMITSDDDDTMSINDHDEDVKKSS